MTILITTDSPRELLDALNYLERNRLSYPETKAEKLQFEYESDRYEPDYEAARSRG